MGTILAILLDSLKFQELANGDIKGVIHRERLIDQLNGLETNDKGLIYFLAEKRNDPKGTYTHMGPRVTISNHNHIPANSHTPNITPSSLNGSDECEKW